MRVKTELEKVSEEAMRFMRGKYELDEVSNGMDELKFCYGNETILTIYINDGYYDFAVGQEVIRVASLDMLKKAKKMIIAAKEPNRRPFPKEQAVLSRCGMRCDLCVHYAGGTISKGFKKELQERIARVYGGESSGDWDSCPGCGILETGKPHPCMGGDSCWQLKCAAQKGVDKCADCMDFQNCRPQVGYRNGIEPRNILAEDVTWAILPYVEEQYGN